MDKDKLFENFPSEENLMNIIMHTSTTVWESELVVKDIESWLSNFKGEVFDLKYERLLGLWLLAHFTFYNKHEVKHLCKIIYRDLIHKIIEGETDLASAETAIMNFFKTANIISPEKTSGSGGFIAYYFRHENELPMTLFNFSIDNISDTVENIIVIDDVTLSEGKAGQMFNFWTDARKKFPSKKFFLLTLMASESSFDFLQKEFKIEIVSAIKLDNRDKCFHAESDVFSSFTEVAIREEIIETCKKFAEHYGNKIAIPHLHPLGHHDGQYTFGFDYNTPDNSLPIFWGQINNWVPILRRYHKNYYTKNFLLNERFI